MTLTALLLVPVFLTSEGNFLPNTANRWAFDAISVSLREGLLGETQYGYYPYPTRGVHDRYGVALLLRQAAANQKERGETLLKGQGSVRECASFLRCAALLPAYRRADIEFKHEIDIIGAHDFYFDRELTESTRQIRARSSSRAALFYDIPPSSWAAKAVGDLRALGLLEGYRDGTFGGG